MLETRYYKSLFEVTIDDEAFGGETEIELVLAPGADRSQIDNAAKATMMYIVLSKMNEDTDV